MIKLGELGTVLGLHRQGLTVSAIARQLGIDRKTVRRHIERGLQVPSYGRRSRGVPIHCCRICATGWRPIPSWIRTVFELGPLRLLPQSARSPLSYGVAQEDFELRKYPHHGGATTEPGEFGPVELTQIKAFGARL